MKAKIYDYATRTLGFDDCKFTTADTSRFMDIYDQWLKAGHQGSMDYLERHQDLKKYPEKLLPGARSAIVLMKNYKNTSERRLQGRFKIARYAVGQDYHLVMTEKLKKLADFLTTSTPGVGEVRCYYGVDSRPIPERSYALQGGIGFLGKNTMIIKPGLGSYFFLGVVLTTLELETDESLKWNCGSCRLCLDACPTQALIGDYQMDAAKCISYQTIEQKTPMTEEQLNNAQGWIYGCDICQEVCPYNHDNVPLTDWTEFRPASGVGFDFFKKNPDLDSKDIPATSPLHRSRNRIIPNIRMARLMESGRIESD